MTERLYYGDPYLREFDAIVTAVDRRGDRIVVTLDRTAFYPTSGGQPFDTGVLAGRPIVDVADEDDGTIVHVIGPEAHQMFTIGEAVRGQINWPRRLDHMQQHTGQHLLSAVLDRLLGAVTVSFHLGTEASTIDLGRELSPRELAAAEEEANRIVWEDRPVTIRYASARDAAGLGLRKASRREGTLRLIEIEGADLSACGGTHVARTGAIGMIAVQSWERFKGGQRLEFLCGGRALGRFRSLRDTVSASVRLLSALSGDVPAAIEKLQVEARDQKRKIAALQDDLVRYRSGELAAGAEVAAAGRVVIRALDADAGGLKALAASVAATPGYVVALISTTRPALVVVARSSDLSMPANAVLASLIARFGGRGGGKAELAQGGGLDAPTDTILEAVRSAIVRSRDHG
jgi:alanyl-tRNA synthetase